MTMPAVSLQCRTCDLYHSSYSPYLVIHTMGYSNIPHLHLKHLDPIPRSPMTSTVHLHDLPGPTGTFWSGLQAIPFASALNPSSATLWASQLECRLVLLAPWGFSYLLPCEFCLLLRTRSRGHWLPAPLLWWLPTWEDQPARHMTVRTQAPNRLLTRPYPPGWMNGAVA